MIPDLSNYEAWVPVIFGNTHNKPHCECDQGEEVDTLAMPWVNTWVAYLLAVWWATATVENDKIAAGESDPREYNEVVTSKDTKAIDAFSSHIIHVRMGTVFTGKGINVMTQALWAGDGSLPRA